MSQKLIALLFIINLYSSEDLYGQEKNWTNKDSCFSYLNIYSNYWKKDSLGKNGFRQLMADFVLKNCHFEGEKWKDINKYLGNPNFIFNLNGKRFYRYRLNYQSKDIKAIGTVLLDIGVEKTGLIVSFSISSVDG